MPKVEVRRKLGRRLARWFISRISVSRQPISQKVSQQLLSWRAPSLSPRRRNHVMHRNSCEYTLSRNQKFQRSLRPALRDLSGKRFCVRKPCVQERIKLRKFRQMSLEFLL